jgi:ParB/RepB/Spo0J family partition protein
MIRAIQDIGTPSTLPIIAIRTETQIRTRNGFDEQSLTELSASIKELGILEPLIVRPHATDDAHFILIAGERRLLAASMAGLAEVPVLIRNTTDIEAATIQAVENLQRENLGLADTAEGVATLLKHYKTPKAVAKALGKSPAWVSKHMAVTRLTPVVREIVDEGKTDDMEILLGMDKIARMASNDAIKAFGRLLDGFASGLTTRASVRIALADLKPPKPRVGLIRDEEEGAEDEGAEESTGGKSTSANREIFGKLELAHEVAKEILAALEYAKGHKPSSRPTDSTIEHVRDFIAKTWA